MLSKSMSWKSEPLSQASMNSNNSEYILFECIKRRVSFSSSANTTVSGNIMWPGAPWSAKYKNTYEFSVDLRTLLVEFEFAERLRAASSPFKIAR